MSRLTQGSVQHLRIRGCHPLWPDFPDRSAYLAQTTGLFRVRSPLLAESLLMSFPPGTEMFQFPGFASSTYVFSERYPCGWVAPFGYPRINACSRLPVAFRSVPRPSSPPGAKASTECPSHARDHPPGSQPRGHHAQKPSSDRLGCAPETNKPASAHDGIILLSTQQDPHTRPGIRTRARHNGTLRASEPSLSLDVRRPKPPTIRSDFAIGAPRDAPEPDSP